MHLIETQKYKYSFMGSWNKTYAATQVACLPVVQQSENSIQYYSLYSGSLLNTYRNAHSLE